jgi:shikimate kinase
MIRMATDDANACIEEMAKSMARAFGMPEIDIDRPFKEETADSRAIHHEKGWHFFRNDAAKIYYGIKAMREHEATTKVDLTAKKKK